MAWTALITSYLAPRTETPPDPLVETWQSQSTKGVVLRFLFSSLFSHPHRSLVAPQSPSSLPTELPRTPPLILILVTLLSAPAPSLLVPFPILPPTLLNTEPLRSMDLPWISPGSPRLPTDAHLRVFLSFPSLASFVSPSSPHPLLLSHLILLLSLIPCITIDFLSH